MWLFGTQLAGASFGNTGNLYRMRPTSEDTTQQKQIAIPSDIVSVDLPASHVTYEGRWYGVGSWSHNILVDEHFRCHILGIRPPTIIPTIAAGGGTGLTATIIGYISFWDEKTEERSPLSGGSASLAATNDDILWGNLPLTSKDSRVTHIEFWRSVDGGTPRLVTRRQLGVTALTESVATLALGEAFTTTFERMPKGSVCAIYNERLAVAGNAEAPDTIYLSAIGFPERYEGLSFKTKKGEPIVAVMSTRTINLILTPTSCYRLRGFTEDDMALDLIDDEIGCIAPLGASMVRGKVWFPSYDGPWMYNGSFHFMGRQNETLWRRWYETYRAQMENGFAITDTVYKTWSFVIPNLTDVITDPKLHVPTFSPTILYRTYVWVADYRRVNPDVSGVFDQPDWSFDTFQQSWTAGANLGLPGSKRRDVFMGFCDGEVRQWDESNEDDDGDGGGKVLWLRLPHYTFGYPGGGERGGGKRFPNVWLYVESEDVEWNLFLKAGNDQAWRQLNPGYQTDIDLTTHWGGILSLLIFSVAYILVIGEETIHLRKSKPVIVAGEGRGNRNEEHVQGDEGPTSSWRCHCVNKSLCNLLTRAS